jgi:putative ABC transport system substrate-binding protein
VGNGFVASLGRPSGNITGLSTVEPELNGKRLELLKEIIPRIARVAVFGTSTNPGNVQGLRETERAAEAFGIRLQYVDILSFKDGETAFRAASKARADETLMNVSGPIFQDNRKEFVGLAIRHRLTEIYEFPSYVRDGGLMFYGIDSPTWTAAPPST